MPIDYSKYPPNWKTEIRPGILKRAGNRCEKCGVQNHILGVRDANGKFYTAEDCAKHGVPVTAGPTIKIVLTISHTNHDINDNRPENLRALCQRCHLRHDREYHAEQRRKNKNEAQPDLYN